MLGDVAKRHLEANSEGLSADEDALEDLAALQARVAELEEALRWYGDKENYRTLARGLARIDLDKGERARAALEDNP